MSSGVKTLLVGVAIILVVLLGNQLFRTSDDPAPNPNPDPDPTAVALGCALSAAGLAKIAEELHEDNSYAGIVAAGLGGLVVEDHCKQVVDSWITDSTATTRLSVNGGALQTATGQQVDQMAANAAQQQADRDARFQYLTDCVTTYGFNTFNEIRCTDGEIRP